jgi:hypothetical protein
VAEPKTVKNRMHFDIEVADVHAEADRLVALGATRVSTPRSATVIVTKDDGGVLGS